MKKSVIPYMCALGMLAWAISAYAGCNWSLKTCIKETVSCGSHNCEYYTYSPTKRTCQTVNWSTGYDVCASISGSGTQKAWICYSTTCGTSGSGCPLGTLICGCADPVNWATNPSALYPQDVLDTLGCGT